VDEIWKDSCTTNEHHATITRQIKCCTREKVQSKLSEGWKKFEKTYAQKMSVTQRSRVRYRAALETRRKCDQSYQKVDVILKDLCTTTESHPTLTGQITCCVGEKCDQNGAYNLNGLVRNKQASQNAHVTKNGCAENQQKVVKWDEMMRIIWTDYTKTEQGLVHTPVSLPPPPQKPHVLLSLSCKCERSTVRSSKWHPSVLQIFELCSTCGFVLQIVLA